VQGRAGHGDPERHRGAHRRIRSSGRGCQRGGDTLGDPIDVRVEAIVKNDGKVELAPA